MAKLSLRLTAPLVFSLMLAACAETGTGVAPVGVQDGAGQTRPKARPGTPEATDAGADQAGAVQPGPGGSLGTTVASLGDPAQPGLWIKTPLTRSPARGRVVYDGRSAAVDLIPIPGEPGAGSRMSLAAFQALGAPITGLPTVEVIRD